MLLVYFYAFCSQKQVKLYFIFYSVVLILVCVLNFHIESPRRGVCYARTKANVLAIECFTYSLIHTKISNQLKLPEWNNERKTTKRYAHAYIFDDENEPIRMQFQLGILGWYGLIIVRPECQTLGFIR